MFGKRWLRAVNELGTVKEVVEYLSRYVPNTLNAKFCEPLIY